MAKRTTDPRDPDLLRLQHRLACVSASAPAALARAQRQLAAYERRRKAELALIHIGWHQLGLAGDQHQETRHSQVRRADAAARGVPEEAAGTSSGDLCRAGREALLRELTASGWQPARKAPRRVRQRQAAETVESVSAKIRALLLDGGYGDEYASSIAQRTWGVDRWEWLGYDELTRLMQMLQIHARRQGRQEPDR